MQEESESVDGERVALSWIRGFVLFVVDWLVDILRMGTTNYRVRESGGTSRAFNGRAEGLKAQE